MNGREAIHSMWERGGRASLRVIAVVAGGLALQAPPAQAVNNLLFAWADQASSAKYEPNAFYLHNGMGGISYIERDGVGDYRVRFGGMQNPSFSQEDYGSTEIASRHVTAYGTSSDYCVLDSTVAQGVRCYDTTGARVDSRYAVTITGRGFDNQNMAAAYADQPAAASYAAIGYSRSHYTSPVVTRAGPGEYTVEFPSFTTYGVGGGNAQVTADESVHPGEGRRCVAHWWSGDRVYVRCFDAAGALADSAFFVTYLRESADLETAAFAWAHEPTTASYTPSSTYSYNPTGGAITAQRLGTGSYTMTWDGLVGIGAGGGQPQVTAYGSLDRRCKIASWAGNTVSIRCFDTSGSPVDTEYSVVFRKPIDRKLLTGRFAAATHRSPASTGTVQLSTDFWNISGTESAPDPVMVTRLSTGRHSVEFQGLHRFGADGGNAQVTALLPGDRCKVEGWSDDAVVVRCFDWSGSPKDAEFTVVFFKPEASNEQLAYAWTSSGSAAVQTPDAFYAHNPSGGAINVVRNSTGLYRATFTGLAGYGVDQGVPFVTAYGTDSKHCKLVYWQDDWVDVRCMAANGVLSDSLFSLVWLKPDLTADGFGTAYADLETTPSYAPLDAKAHNPTGGVIEAEGPPVPIDAQYRMDWDGFVERGVNVFRRFALVSAVGADSVSCSGEAFAVYGGTVDTSCSDSNGVETASKYAVVLIEPIALPEPSVGAQLGVGLLGLVGLARGRRRRSSESHPRGAAATRSSDFSPRRPGHRGALPRAAERAA